MLMSTRHYKTTSPCCCSSNGIFKLCMSLQAKHPYPIRTVRPRTVVTPEALADALANAADTANLKGQQRMVKLLSNNHISKHNANTILTRSTSSACPAAVCIFMASMSDGHRENGNGCAGVLTRLVPSGPALVEHCILGAQLDLKRDVKATPLTQGEISALLASLQAMHAWFEDQDTSQSAGYIFYKPKGMWPFL